jgi:hypothetical protein
MGCQTIWFCPFELIFRSDPIMKMANIVLGKFNFGNCRGDVHAHRRITNEILTKHYCVLPTFSTFPSPNGLLSSHSFIYDVRSANYDPKTIQLNSGHFENEPQSLHKMLENR